MTEEVKDAATQDESGEPTGRAMPEVPSGSSPVASSAQPSEDVGKAILERLDQIEAKVSDDRLSDLVDARVKSDKDIRFNKVQTELSEMRDVVEASGGDFSKVEGQLTIDRLNQRIDNLEAGVGVDLGRSDLSAEWQEAQVDTDIILMSAGWLPDDPRYTEFFNRYNGQVSPEKWPGMVETFVDKMGKQEGVNPAAIVGEGEGITPAAGGTPNALERQYKERLDALPQGDVRQIANLKAEFRKKGLVVW